MRLSNNIISYDWSNSTTEKKLNSPTWAWETAAMAVVEKNNSGNSFSQQDHPRHGSGCLTLASNSSSEFVSRFLLLLRATAASHATRYANKKQNQFFSFCYVSCFGIYAADACGIRNAMRWLFFASFSRNLPRPSAHGLLSVVMAILANLNATFGYVGNSLCSHVAFFTNFSALSAPIVVRRDANSSSSETPAVAERQNKKELITTKFNYWLSGSWL